MQSKMIKIAALALSLGMLGGCADTNQLADVKAAADAAMARANDAYNLAQTAHSISSDAAYAAQEAQSTAEAALACCNANGARLDRMFEKAMAK